MAHFKASSRVFTWCLQPMASSLENKPPGLTLEWFCDWHRPRVRGNKLVIGIQQVASLSMANLPVLHYPHFCTLMVVWERQARARLSTLVCCCLSLEALEFILSALLLSGGTRERERVRERGRRRGTGRERANRRAQARSTSSSTVNLF